MNTQFESRRFSVLLCRLGLGILTCLFSVPALVQEALVPYALSAPILNLVPAQRVTLNGTVTTVSSNRFVLQDSSGEVLVETFPDWYRTFSLAEGDNLRVIGELNLSGTFDAFKLLHEDGTTTLIRPFYGLAPWHSGEPLRIIPTRVW